MSDPESTDTNDCNLDTELIFQTIIRWSGLGGLFIITEIFVIFVVFLFRKNIKTPKNNMLPVIILIHMFMIINILCYFKHSIVLIMRHNGLIDDEACESLYASYYI